VERRFGSLIAGIMAFEHLAATADGAGVSELARDLELDKGYLHRLPRTLESTGYVEQDSATKVFRPTVKFIALSGAIRRGSDGRSRWGVRGD
jgi:DNA-binding IclR family transcriptional regulator